MKFSEYLKSFVNENTPYGDLARDFIASKSKATTYKGIKKSIDRYSPCDAALSALESIYKSFLILENNNH